MDDGKRIITWFLNKKKCLNLKIKSYDWCTDFLPGYFDYSVEINFENESYTGRGTANSEELALTKAMAETIERTLIKFNKLDTSNGVAVHFDQELAKNSAKNELLERDSFFCHFLTHTPYSEIDSKLLPQQISDCLQKLLLKNVTVKFYRMQTANGQPGIVCRSSGARYKSTFGSVVGLGSHAILENALYSAFYECVRSTIGYMYQNEQIKHQAKEVFLSKQKHNILDHIHLSLDLNYAHSLDYMFQNESLLFSENLQNLSIEYQPLEMPELFRDVGLHAVIANNINLQNLFFGKSELKNINLSRLERFAGRALTQADINFTPHPLG